MSRKTFEKISRGLDEAKAYMEAKRAGYKLTVQPTLQVKNLQRNPSAVLEALCSRSASHEAEAVARRS